MFCRGHCWVHYFLRGMFNDLDDGIDFEEAVSLQKDMDRFGKWAKIWHIEYSIAECKAMNGFVLLNTKKCFVGALKTHSVSCR